MGFCFTLFCYERNYIFVVVVVVSYRLKESLCCCSHYEDSVESVNFPELSTKELQQLAIQLKIQVQKIIELLWLFLELHMLKLMLLSIMLLCVFDVSDAAAQP
jgi:hypothetical protein